MKYIFPKIEYSNNKEIFMLFLALNVLGYHEENNKKMFWLRREVRKQLSDVDFGKKYQKLAKILKKQHQWYFINALLKKVFLRNYKGNKEEKEFFLLLDEFSKEKVIRDIWVKYGVRHGKEEAKLLILFKKNVKGVIEFLKQEKYKTKKIILIPVLLDAYWRGYSFKVGDIGCVVFGPGAEERRGLLLRHELLHILVPQLRLIQKIEVGKGNKKLEKMGYVGKKVIKEEYLVRAINYVYQKNILKFSNQKWLKELEKDFKGITNLVDKLECLLC